MCLRSALKNCPWRSARRTARCSGRRRHESAATRILSVKNALERISAGGSPTCTGHGADSDERCRQRSSLHDRLPGV